MDTHRRRGFSIQNYELQDEYTIDNDLADTQIKRKKSVYDTDYKQPYFICFLYYTTLPFAYIYNKIPSQKKKTIHEL